MNQRVGLMPSTAPRRVHLAGVSQMGRSFRHGVCAYSPETYSRLLAELHHSRAARIRVAGGGAGGDAPDAQASALGLPYGQPQPPKRLSLSWDTTNHGGVQREASFFQAVWDGENLMQLTAVFIQVSEGYIAFVEELPGANTQGTTLDEARENLQEAVALVLEANRELAERSLTGQTVTKEPFVLAS